MITEIANLPISVSLIPLSRGSYAIVDNDDLRILNLYRWSERIDPGGSRYARRHEKGKTIYMHREIMNAPDGMEIDHINGNGLDNRRENLRLCTKAQNQQNSKKRPGKTSIFKGVCWVKNRRMWRSEITVNKKRIFLGYFLSEMEAAKVYDREALYYFGEFAKTNFKDANNGTKPPISDNPAILVIK